MRIVWVVVTALALGAATGVGATTLAGFGRCLKSQGATFYGTSWCPYCRAQRETLGDAMDYVRYVECSVDGERGEPDVVCRKAGVDSYPTWTFGDGSRKGGALSLEELADRTGCTLPQSAR
jgi:hypothetical protein